MRLVFPLMSTTCLITGATGFVGGHLAEACVKRGLAVRSLARPGGDVSVLEACGATVLRGDLTDGASVRAALEGAEVVFHCAARWATGGRSRTTAPSTWRGSRAAGGVPAATLQRFVHFSSLGVYAARHHHGTDETEPLPERHMDGYTQSKVESERLALHINANMACR